MQTKPILDEAQSLGSANNDEAQSLGSANLDEAPKQHDHFFFRINMTII
jgi:hypothetical protein